MQTAYSHRQPLSLMLGVLIFAATLTPTAVMIIRGYEASIATTVIPRSQVPVAALLIHGVPATLFLILGAWQILRLPLAPLARHQHRQLGLVLWLLSMFGALSGLYLTLRWPDVSGSILYYGRLIAGSFWVVALILALHALALRDYRSHGRWMLANYGLALTAGTLPFLMTPVMLVLLLFGGSSLMIEEALQVLAWPLNIWLILALTRRARRRPKPSMQKGHPVGWPF
ncbi:DUF2306 domain-containing protein [Phaeobacter sp. CNT1-3]|nr:DUF2306 domain-containing protein [Phaeobacter sp. CNT1-3]